MKKIAAAVLCLLYWTPVFAFDVWVESNYESGESIFRIQSMPSLVVGQNGIGLMYIQFFSGKEIVAEKTTLTIDGKQYPVELTSIGPLFLTFKDGNALIPAIASAKKISLKTRQCPFDGCVMSKTGGTHKVIEWEFERTLAEQFEDYKARIR